MNQVYVNSDRTWAISIFKIVGSCFVFRAEVYLSIEKEKKAEKIIDDKTPLSCVVNHAI